MAAFPVIIIYIAPLIFGLGMGSLLMFLLRIAPRTSAKWGMFALGLIAMVAFGYFGNIYVWPKYLQTGVPNLMYALGLGIIFVVLCNKALIKGGLLPPNTAEDTKATDKLMQRDLATRVHISVELQQQTDQLRTYRQDRNFIEAVEVCKKLEDDTAFNSVASLPEEVGKTFFSMGLYSDAIKYFEKAIEIEPNTANLRYALGLAYSRIGKSELAIKELEKANQIDSNDVEVLTALGYQYFVDDDLQKAIRYTERALSIDPNLENAKNNSAYFNAVAKRDLPEALRKATDLVSANPNNATYLDTKGTVHLAIGEIDDAIESLEKANSLEPNNPYITQNLKEAYKRKSELIKI